MLTMVVLANVGVWLMYTRALRYGSTLAATGISVSTNYICTVNPLIVFLFYAHLHIELFNIRVFKWLNIIMLSIYITTNKPILIINSFVLNAHGRHTLLRLAALLSMMFCMKLSINNIFLYYKCIIFYFDENL